MPAGYNWRPYNLRLVGHYIAPYGITLSSNYPVRGLHYSGPIVTRLSAPDLRFGPPTITLANGTTQPNPLATTIRFANATRGEGQVLNEPIRILQIRVGKMFKFDRNQLRGLGQCLQRVELGREHSVQESGRQPDVQPELSAGVQQIARARVSAPVRV